MILLARYTVNIDESIENHFTKADEVEHMPAKFDLLIVRSHPMVYKGTVISPDYKNVVLAWAHQEAIVMHLWYKVHRGLYLLDIPAQYEAVEWDFTKKIWGLKQNRFVNVGKNLTF